MIKYVIEQIKYIFNFIFIVNIMILSFMNYFFILIKMFLDSLVYMTYSY